MNVRKVLQSCVGLSLVWATLAATTALGQSVLLMPEPLDGYIVSKAAIGSVEKPQGYLITAEREGVVDKVQIVVEFRDVKQPETRIAAAKGYLNGFSQSLVDAGLKVSGQAIPEITRAAVQRKLIADVTYTQPDDSTIYTRHHIFFGQHGYDARVIATSEESLAQLSAWANQIRPADPQRQ